MTRRRTRALRSGWWTRRGWLLVLLSSLVLTTGSAVAQLQPLGPQFQVNTSTYYSQRGPSVAPDGSGGFVVAWSGYESAGSDSDDESVQAQRIDSTGAPVGAEFQVNTYTTSEQRSPSVAPDGSGGFVVVWRSTGSGGTDTSYTSIQAQRFSAAGTPVGGEFQVNTYTTSNQSQASVAPDDSGGFVVAWSSEGSSGTDTDSTSVQGQRFSSSGMPLGAQFQVNTYSTSYQYHPEVGSDGAGGFVVVWTSSGSSGTDTSGYSIQAQRFSGAGTPFGGEFQVNTYTTGDQGSFGQGPSVAPDGSGGFVVVWASAGSSGTDTSSDSIQAQRFSAAGTPVGGEFQVNTATYGSQNSPSASLDGTGGFIVVWQDGIGNDIQAQRFSSAGMPLGEQFEVNSYTASSQTSPSVATDGNGQFLVAWTSRGSLGTDTDNDSIQARLFSATTTTTSTTTTTLPGLVPGGPPKKASSDCYLELAVANVQNDGQAVEQNKTVICEDGTACDSDGVCDDICFVQIGLCVNQADPSLPTCTPPPGLTRVKVRGGTALSVPADLGQPGCGPLVSQPVLINRNRKGEYRAKKSQLRVRGLAVATKGTRPRKDKDKWTIQCVPNTNPATCAAP
jgi:hypothetical protein